VKPVVSPCGEASVTVNWNSQIINISGHVYNWCKSGGYVQLFLSWTGSYHNNKLIGTAGPTRSNWPTNVSVNWSSTANNPSYIAVTVCEHYQNEWRCGNPIPM
jgi:hypothetical protein